MVMFVMCSPKLIKQYSCPQSILNLIDKGTLIWLWDLTVTAEYFAHMCTEY